MQIDRKRRKEFYRMDTSVIIVAAGSSTRMQGTNKQLAEVGGIPVIVRSMLAFEKCDSVSEIIVVTREESIETFKALAAEYLSLIHI